MELVTDPDASSGCPAVKKKRSENHRRPHSDVKQITSWQHIFTFPTSSTDLEVHGVGRTPQSFSLSSAGAIKFVENHLDGLKNPSVASDRLGNDNKLKKVKLKLGGITRTLLANSPSEIDKQKRDVSRNISDGKESSSRRTLCEGSHAMSENYSYKLVQKSSRTSKKRAVDDRFDDEDDEEIRYLKKLRAYRASSGYAERLEEGSRKTKGISKIMGLTDSSDYGSFGFDKGGRKSRIYENNDYEELDSDDELKDKKKRMAADLADPFMGSGNEMTMTTRKRALECLDAGGHVEFPDGLPEASSKKQKLSEVEQQLRKAEAAERRRLQAEKAAKKAEAEAIRKILGQDSNRKKKEEKLKKQQEELAQEKTGKAAALGPNTVRCIMGPRGTVVTFSEDLGLPKIFDPQPCRYPPPREKCVGPNCTNEYKYRDSKSKLPLCSLNCYTAVQGKTVLLPAC